MDIDAYLQRIAYTGSLDLSLATLGALHLAHLYTVPFENLDIHLGRSIVLDTDALFDKIVVRRRGGFCYELNGLFAALLGALGFDVTYLSASDARDDGTFGPEFDHLTLLVTTDEDPRAENREPRIEDRGSRIEDRSSILDPRSSAIWLADVGWGDTFCQPLQLESPHEQVEGRRAYQFERDGAYRILWQRGYSGEWERHYRFTLQPRRYAEFEPMCRYHQTSPQSLFTQKRLCTRATPDGRITLDQSRLITTTHGQRRELIVGGEDEYRQLLREHFGIDLVT